MEEITNETSSKMDARVKGVLLVVSAYIVTMGIAICIIAFTMISLAETHSCSTMSRALLTLWIIIAVLFLISIAVVGLVARKVIPSRSGCQAPVVGQGVLMLASFLCVAFGLMVAFNC